MAKRTKKNKDSKFNKILRKFWGAVFILAAVAIYAA